MDESCVRGYSLEIQTQPTPARIMLELVRSGLLKVSVLGLVGSRVCDYTRGYHVYKDNWEASIGERLLCQCENGNCADPFAVVPGCL